MPQATYRLCPRCYRAVASSTGERYCMNDGERLLTRCERCHTQIVSPHAEYCPRCGERYGAAPPSRLPDSSPRRSPEEAT